MGGAALLLAPVLLAELRFLKSYDPQTKNASGLFLISEQFVSFGKYFYDSTHRWFSPEQYPPQHNFVQIDYAIWIPIAAAIAFLAWGLTTQARRNRWRRIVDSFDRPVVGFLLASLVLYLFLQLPFSYFVYRLFFPLKFINFPWRMLSFIIPIGLILVTLIADQLVRSYPQRVVSSSVAGLWLASLVLLSPITSSSYGLFGPSRPFSSITLFTAPKYVDYQSYQGTPLYDISLPKVVGADGREVEAGHELIDYALLHRHQDGAQSLTDVPCTIVGPPYAAFETLELRFSVSCRGATQVALPISYNDYSSLFVKRPGGALRRIPYFHRRTDPRIIIDVPSSEREEVVVHLPTLWGTLH